MTTLTTEQAQQIENAFSFAESQADYPPDDLMLYHEALYTIRAARAQEPEYDLSNVIHLTHNKAKHIIKSRGYAVTGFVLTREDGGKCIVDMSAVRWFDDKLVFQRMMHSDTPKEWLSPPVEHVKQEPVGVVTKESLDGVVKWNGWIPREGTKLYATPVRTKDLTDDEIEAIHGCPMAGWVRRFARAVIAADREKNK